jgi:hypothetical protein
LQPSGQERAYKGLQPRQYYSAKDANEIQPRNEEQIPLPLFGVFKQYDYAQACVGAKSRHATCKRNFAKKKTLRDDDAAGAIGNEPDRRRNKGLHIRPFIEKVYDILLARQRYQQPESEGNQKNIGGDLQTMQGGE